MKKVFKLDARAALLLFLVCTMYVTGDDIDTIGQFGHWSDSSKLSHSMASFGGFGLKLCINARRARATAEGGLYSEPRARLVNLKLAWELSKTRRASQTQIK